MDIQSVLKNQNMRCIGLSSNELNLEGRKVDPFPLLRRPKKLTNEPRIRLEPYLKEIISEQKITDFPRVQSWKYNHEFVEANAIEMVNMSEFIKMIREVFAGNLYIDSWGDKNIYSSKPKVPIDINFRLEMLFVNPMGIMYAISGYAYIYQLEGKVDTLTFANNSYDSEYKYVLLNDGTVV